MTVHVKPKEKKYIGHSFILILIHVQKINKYDINMSKIKLPQILKAISIHLSTNDYA